MHYTQRPPITTDLHADETKTKMTVGKVCISFDKMN